MTGEFYRAQLRAILNNIESAPPSTEDGRVCLRHLQQIRAQVRRLKKIVCQEIRLARAPSAVIRTGTVPAAQLANELLGRDGARIVRALGTVAAKIDPIRRGAWELEDVVIDIDNALLRLDSAIAESKRWVGHRRSSKSTRAVAF